MIPLFIKYPKQPHGTIDRRKAETIDVMPTIADALHAQLPADWKFDGTSLLKPAPKRHRSLVNIKHTDKVISDVHDAVFTNPMSRATRPVVASSLLVSMPSAPSVAGTEGRGRSPPG